MSFHIDIENVSSIDSIPNEKSIIKWVKPALEKKNKNAEICLRIVDIDEAQYLNKEWRNKDSATNVLSFPVGETIEHAPNLLGDIVICATIVEEEAKQQEKDSEAHWAHLIIHGILHLQGYDHLDDDEAAIMEKKEIDILSKNGFANPYEVKSK